VENEMGQPVEYGYDLAGRRLRLTDAEGNTTAYAYDAASRLTRMTYPGGESESYAYDASGLLVEKTTPVGDAIQYGYDGAGRLASVTAPDAGANYTRDSAGAVTADGVRAYEYDAFGRLTAATDLTLGKTLAYGYDARGLRSRMVLPAGPWWTTPTTGRGG
jgi:YD repeat-containing protein